MAKYEKFIKEVDSIWKILKEDKKVDANEFQKLLQRVRVLEDVDA